MIGVMWFLQKGTGNSRNGREYQPNKNGINEKLNNIVKYFYEKEYFEYLIR